MTKPWVAVAGGVALAVRLTPRGGRDSIDGIEQLTDGRAVLKVRVTAPPSEGEVLRRATSLWLRVPRRASSGSPLRAMAHHCSRRWRR
jgi:uncharacterized protein